MQFEEAPLAELADLLPSNTTRAETALSRFPIHNLTKSEKIDIRISKRSGRGEAELYWSVSPSRDFGEPRQLAYKLDTLLINRRIDEAGRPIPKVIRLGSLREICKELGSSAGKASSDIKTALQQNASAFITAKVNFRGADGTEQRFEASFTRYSLRFYGQSLPDGRRADAVYIILNDEYWALLKKAQFRPLNYDYLKELSPGAQRFYEIVSYKIFAALSQKRPQAKLLYSEYCTRAPQARYLDGKQVRKQMYKIHQPHIAADYIADIQYHSVTNEEGEPDWEMLYAPGRKARAEYYAFTRGKVITLESQPGEKREGETPDLLHELLRRGIEERRARALLDSCASDQPILAQLEWGDHVIKAADKERFRNPPGFYVYLIKSNVIPPQDLPAKPPSKPPPAADPLLQPYRDFCRREIERHLRATEGDPGFRRTVETRRQQLNRQFPALRPETIAEVALQGARTAAAKAVKLPTLEEFRAARQAA